MEEMQDIKAMYEKLHTLFCRHPSTIDQYSDLRKMIIKSGLKVRILFRGKDSFTDNLAGRYEIWISTNLSHTKMGKGDSLGEAVKDAVTRCIWIYQLQQQSGTTVQN